MRNCLILLTSSYPFGPGEPFIANEIDHLSTAFDEVMIVSNDTAADPSYAVPKGVEVLRIPYELPMLGKLLSAFALLQLEPRNELIQLRRSGLPINKRALATILVSWCKGMRFSRIIKRLARARPGARVHAYSYWANDMAIAAALARQQGWVDNAVCRAHRWEVYSDDASSLPFRHFLATRLDRYLFISEDGLEYFRRRVGDYASLGCSRLGTRRLSDGPLSGQHPFVVVSCSSMIPRKRVELIAEALTLMECAATWIHIGDGPSRPAVEAVCARLPPNVRAEFAGQRSNEQVLALLQSRHPSVFVNLSDSEGVPVSIMEAMSAGVPVVATSVGGVGEIVIDGKNGRLLSPDPAAVEVATALKGFVGMPDQEYRRCAGAAWSTWSGKFNADKNYIGFLQTAFGLTPRGEGARPKQPAS